MFDDDAELVAFVKRAYGSCLTGDTRDRALLIEYGARFNGKIDAEPGHPARARRLRAHGADPRRHAHPAGGDPERDRRPRPQAARRHRRDRRRPPARREPGEDAHRPRQDRRPRPHREWFEFEPEYKLVLYTNFRPKVDGSDGAVWDRIRLIPFRVSFADREDQELGDKLAAEAEGILAWLVEGCLEWQDSGLGSCDAVEQATAAYRTENDVIGRFVDECCELGDDFRVERKELRAALATFCDDNGDEVPPATTIGRWLTERGARESKAGGRKGYRGIRLRDGDK